ncbi:class I SAM-dependent methyltransferase [Paraburkholderia fungorum]|uniref:class I SAM-dependent methyltransferase n=1 Tax=Paraburkholderia fungorum TaxID=134537 RepID=UPI000DAF49AD|nr:class I SAM-dependent methyltransferase [Paraburkholderia fungorum]PZR43051.1 MAG: hypothetical protein DI523_28745 [Paraburkholderia fungorum]
MNTEETQRNSLSAASRQETHDARADLPMDGERFIPGMYESIMLEHYHRYLLAGPMAAGLRVLDIACGEGYGTASLARSAGYAIGVDISEDAVRHARCTYSASNLEYRVGNAAEIPVETGSIDLVVSFETIEHHDRHKEMMAEIKRVLKPNGLLLISSPNKYEYSDVPRTSNPFHVKELYLDEFRALLADTFANQALWGQRILSGSLVAPIDGQTSGFAHFAEQTTITSNRPAKKALRKPLYFIALASDGPLPTLDTSVLESQDVFDEAIPRVETKIFWSAAGAGFNEHQSAAEVVRADGKPQSVTFLLEQGEGTIGRLRYDITDRSAVVRLRLLQLLNANDEIQWQWSGNEDSLIARRNVAVRHEAGQLVVVAMGEDPGFEIELPADVSARAVDGWKFHAIFSATLEVDDFQSIGAIEHLHTGLQASMNSFADNLAGNAARVEQELARVSARLDAQQHAVDVQLAQAQKELTSLRNSLSWRLTAPLRGIASRIRRIVS